MNISLPTVLSILAFTGHAHAQTGGVPRPVPFSGDTFRAVSATRIIGLTTDGSYIFGETIVMGQDTANRSIPVIAYDAAQLNGYTPTCADLAPHFFNDPSTRYDLGLNYAFQSWAEDIIPVSGTEGTLVSEIVFAASIPLTDNGAGTTSEVLQVLFESWEGIDNFPDLDGTDGEFGATPDGLGFPFSLTDANGDTFVDELLGGFLISFANVDANGDTVLDEHASLGASGYGLFIASGLQSLGVPLTSNLDLWDGGNLGTDARPDGGIRLIMTRGIGNGNGSLPGGFYPTTNGQFMLWSTFSMQGGMGGCGFVCNGFGAGDSDGIVWGEGEDLTGNGHPAWSQGAPSGNTIVDDIFDTTHDVSDWTNFSPNQTTVGLMLRIGVDSAAPFRDCCDINGDFVCNAADLGAWIGAFTSRLCTCDVNQNGFCTPADFGAWIGAYAASTSVPPAPLKCRF